MLPASPWKDNSAPQQVVAPVASAAALLASRRWTLIGAGVALMILGVIVGLLVWQPWKESADNDHATRANNRELSETLAKGQKLLSEGQFRLAQQQLEKSPGQLARLAPPVRQVWRQTLRQAALLADLSPEPLEEILRHATRVSHEEWLAEFARRYQDKAIVFDAEFYRLRGEGWATEYLVGEGSDQPRLILDNLQVFGPLPGGESQRLLLGVRLASIRLEAPGPQWVIRFHPDSGVLLTDRGAVTLLAPALGSPEIDDVLRRQEKWVKEAALP